MTAKIFPSQILFTSFDTWMPHQKSNASDDLLGKISQQDWFADSFILLRKLPVDPAAAPKEAIAKINQVQPDAVICCGMAESRQKLTVESQAFSGENCRKTSVNLPQLIAGLPYTEISHDAGKFVCEALYYAVLNYLQTQAKSPIPCIFVHVPLLHPGNIEAIAADFGAIVQRLAAKPPVEPNSLSHHPSHPTPN
jgi:pyroglutamyl-peptidase